DADGEELCDRVVTRVGEARLPEQPPTVRQVLVRRVGERPRAALRFRGPARGRQYEQRNLLEGDKLLIAPRPAKPLSPSPSEEPRWERYAGHERYAIRKWILETRGRLARLRVEDGEGNERLSLLDPPRPGPDRNGRDVDPVLRSHVPRDIHEPGETLSAQEG